MLRAAIEKRAVLDKGTSLFKTNERETKISKDEWEFQWIFTDILEPFSIATQHVCQTVTSKNHRRVVDFASMTVEHHNFLFTSLSNCFLT